jgi:hypothetical protein
MKLVNKDNYFQTIANIGVHKLSKQLKEDHDYVNQVTENNSTWDYYSSSDSIRSVIDQHFADVQQLVMKKHDIPAKAKKIAKEITNHSEKHIIPKQAAIELIKTYVLRGDSYEHLKASHLGSSNTQFHANIEKGKIHVTQVNGKAVKHSFSLKEIFDEIADEGKVPERKPASHAAPKATPKTEKKTSAKVNEVERIDEEVRFIKRYALLDGKTKTQSQILSFLGSVQKAILEKRIRKTSDYATEIKYIQDNLIRVYEKMDEQVTVKLKKDILDKYLSIAASEKIRPSIAFLKRYIGIQGRHITKEKAERLLSNMKIAVKKGEISKGDPYAERLNIAYQSLQKFVDVAKPRDTIEIHSSVLNGINDALDGLGCAGKMNCGCHGLNGLENEHLSIMPATNKNRVMNSMDFANLKFENLGFTGKWLDLIGDPAKGFTAMVFGKPKMGKSYLCVDFAGYLARNFGKVLYVAKEEKLDATLQKKLNDKNVKHPNLFVSDFLPADLSAYQYVFLDSVNKLQLEPQDLEQIKTENPGVSFIYVFQTTKEGNFRGANEFQHDVDVVIEIPAKGKAVQFGRFNQGGELDIFGTPE